MAGATREQALSLLSAAKNHADLAVKLSSLKQAKEILLSLEPSVAAELFPYIVQLQASPESLVRKFLVELIEELTPKVMEQSSVLLPVLLAFLKDDASMVVRQSIVSGINIFCSCLEAMTIQFHQSGRVERWLEELWMWMTKLKDAIFGVSLEPVSVGTKLLAIKFLEMYVLLFTSDSNDSEISFGEGKRRTFNISRVVNGHPILDPSLLTGEVNKTLGHLLDLVQSANTLSGPQIIAVINCLAAIARKRPLHFGNILSVLLGFDPNFETVKPGHSASIQYSLRTALLGFLRCTHPAIIESRDKLLKALRAMNAGDTADQVIRKVDKMLRNNDRVLRDSRFSKEDQPSSQLSVSDDMTRKRSMLQGTEELFNVDELPAKRICYNFVGSQPLPVQVENGPAPYTTANGLFTQVPSSDNTPSPTEQMISVIGALLALGEKGAESLEILVSEIHPDQMADIVMANMKNLPKNPPAIASRLGIVPVTSQMRSSSTAPVVEPAAPTFSQQPPDSLSHATLPLTSTIATNAASSDLTPTSNLPADYKRDPRRDPRRLDPRRTPAPTEVQSLPVKENIGDLQPMKECSTALSTPLSLSLVEKVDNTPSPLMCKSEEEPLNNLADTSTDVLSAPDEGIEIDQGLDIDIALESPLSPLHNSEPDLEASRTDIALTEKFGAYVLDYDEHSPAVSNSSASEETTHDLPLVPLYVDLTEEQKISVSKLAVERIFESCKRQRATGFCQTRMALLARLVAQTDADDEIVAMLQKHTILDYQQQKGHELALSVLYYLHTTLVSTSEEHSTFVSRIYEKFLLAVAKSLWDKLPSSDKSFSRFLGDVPLLPDSALKLLEELSFSDDQNEKDARDADRITQGLGAVWSLILWRPVDRKACLNIALRCAVHTQEDVRAKAIRLVANKLYSLSYVSENIEQFATSMLLSVTGQQVSDAESPQAEPPIERMEGNVGGQESSVSGSQNSDPGGSESGTVKSVQQVSRSATTLSMSQAHRNMSLFFALCIKKPSLLQLVFDIYGRAPKTIKQAVHRHIPILVKNLGSSYSELLLIISDPPQGSENLLMLVLQILTEETAPSAELIATVKYLYETKLKDAAILIPMLSLLSKDEVLPIFPRLVDLPLEKFQTALARILQGSAHTGPALTPAEVLVAVHDINPEKDNIALKKITDACSACFEQRTVFTQQVLAKALNQLVEKTPIPLLFMRTVIQAVDAFPSLVDVVMDILSKLVSKQIWKMPKLWVGFLKCAAQTQPHSFHVLLQLPPQQLESALSKHANLRGSLVAHASQPSIRSSLSRATLMVLGIANESPTPRPFLPSPFHASDTSSSVHGATLT